LRRVIALGGLIAGIALCALAPGASASTFTGDCTWDGYMKFLPKMTWVVTPAGYELHSKGRCKGLLDGEPFDGKSSADVLADMHQPMSCAVGQSFKDGPAVLRFAKGALDADLADGTTKPPSINNPPAKTSKKSKHKKKKHKKKKKKKKRSTHKASTVTAAVADPVDPELEITIDEINLTNQAALHVNGASAGHGVAYGQWVNFDAGKVFSDCAGDGLPGLDFHVELHVLSQLYG
jgi:hypothetical protein